MIASLVVLGSGSRGNCFALVAEGAILLIDAGFSVREVERRLDNAGCDPRRLVAIAVTHEHGDHASGATRLAARHDVPLLASAGTWRTLAAGGEPCAYRSIGTTTSATAGPFTVCGCPTSHDAAEPIAVGVVIAGGISVGVAYDLGRPTQAVRWFLRDRHCLVLEANHDETLLRTSRYPIAVQQRIAGPGGHLSNRDAARLLAEVHHTELGTVVLAHLSQRCNTAGVARGTVGDALRECGFRGTLHVAEQDGPMAPITVTGPRQASLFV
ncbi:MAG: MBL fold metallo-hydrolase [Gemmatimonadales bacterium]